MRKFVLAVGLVLMASGAQAATLDVVGGQLYGASDVLVDGSLYDVQFLDGACIDLYNWCDEASDFTFQTQASAILAAQALLDQVFIDGPEGNFGSIGNLTNGCGSTVIDERCNSITPWQAYQLQLMAPNEPITQVALIIGTQCLGSTDTSNIACYFVGSNPFIPPYIGDTTRLRNTTFAVWSISQVPEPNTALLLSLGLTGLSWKGRRSLRS